MRKSDVPADVWKILAATPEASALWQGLTAIGRRDFISWIDAAKLPETRKCRIESLPSRLASGKRGPCCYSRVPLGLYSALNANTKAKAAWKTLTPDRKRDFADWVEQARESAARTERAAKACAMLAAGKRRV